MGREGTSSRLGTGSGEGRNLLQIGSGQWGGKEPPPDWGRAVGREGTSSRLGTGREGGKEGRDLIVHHKWGGGTDVRGGGPTFRGKHSLV